MYYECIKLLKKNGIKIEQGLSKQELSTIEEIYDISFPKSLKSLYSIGLPVSNGFYNWRSLQDDNIRDITFAINYPFNYLYEHAEEVDWCDDWGEFPEKAMDRCFVVRNKLKKAPKLIPIFAHRYVLLDGNDNPIVLSIHGMDVICYGENLKEYFKVEFGEKEQNCIDFKNISHVTFWSDLM